MSLVLIHDWLNQIGGAEDVLEKLVDRYPGAPIYTSIYAPELMPAMYRRWPIRTSFMDRLPGVHQHHQPYLPLYPLAFERFDLRGHTVLLSNKSGFCHGVRKPEGARHICYCLTPTRYVWNFDDYAGREGLGPAVRLALQPMLAWMRRWDRRAADGVDTFIAISTTVQERIARIYERESTIIYPPVDTTRFAAAPSAARGRYLLSLGRLIPYKRVDLAVEACTRLGLELWVAGSGRDRARLEKLAGPTIRFLGRVPEAEVPGLFANARAFLFPGLEDFGIAPVQALAAGTPVVAFAGGGALDTVRDGENGLLFREQTVESLAAALDRLDGLEFERAAVRATAAPFDTAAFLAQIADAVARAAP
ncbi:MAG: glycosyltransferase [Anaerolineales bacterium]|nr:glycosyltransferase [Anaerolineales bacterium]